MNPLQRLLTEFQAGGLSKAHFIEQMFAHHGLLDAYAKRLDATDIQRIEIGRGEVTAVLEDGLRMIIDATDRRTMPLEILHWGSFEPIERSILMAMLSDGATFLDIGANVGWYSMLATRQFADVTVHAFEPVPATYARLQRHLQINNITNVATHPFGFSDHAGQSTFFFDPAMTGNASARNVAATPRAIELTVQLDTLDAFVHRVGLTADVIKIDVEGAELLVLQGGADVLSRDTPALMIEILRKWSAPFGYHPNDILEMLRAMGYRVFVAPQPNRLTAFGRVDEHTLETNYFFLHTEKHAELIAQLTVAS